MSPVRVSDLALAGSAAVTYRVHTVVKGDTLWGIAEKYLGSGVRCKEIKTLNGLDSDHHLHRPEAEDLQLNIHPAEGVQSCFSWLHPFIFLSSSYLPRFRGCKVRSALCLSERGLL